MPSAAHVDGIEIAGWLSDGRWDEAARSRHLERRGALARNIHRAGSGGTVPWSGGELGLSLLDLLRKCVSDPRYQTEEFRKSA